MSSIARPLTRGFPIGLFLAAAVLVAGSSAGAWLWASRGSDAGVGTARSAAARAAAAEAAVDELSADVAVLTRRLNEAIAANDKLAGRLDRVSETLWASIRRLRGELAAARSGSKEALAGVEGAVAEARSAARQLSVLEDRFEYHLRSDHGGG